MPKFGKRSMERLETCHPELQRLFKEVVKYYDCSVLCGHRGETEQNQAYDEGRSKLRFPESKHNKKQSIAVDVAPYFKNRPHIRWDDMNKFYEFEGFVLGVASQLGIRIRSGLNWDMDDELKDQTFFDGPHFELAD